MANTISRAFIIAIFIALIPLCLPSVTVAQDDHVATFHQKAEGWEKRLSDIENALIEDAPKSSVTDKFREELRLMRSSAGEENRLAEEEMSVHKQRLSALGNKPAEEEGVVEDETIVKRREEISENVRQADARIKRSALIIAKSNEMLDRVYAYEQRKKRTRLLRRQISDPLSAGYFAAIPNELRNTAELWSEATPTREIISAGLLTLAVLLGAICIYVAERKATSHLRNSGKLRSIAPPSILIALAALLTAALTCLQYGKGGAVLFESRIALSGTLAFFLSGVALVALWHTMPARDVNYGKFWRLALRLAKLLLAFSMLAILTGYVYLGVYIAVNVSAFFFSLSVFISLRLTLIRFSQTKQRKGISPLSVALAEPVLGLLCAQIWLISYGASPEDIWEWLARYKEGLTIGSIRIHPVDLLIGVAFFFGLLFISRGAQWFISERIFPNTQLDVGVRNAVIAVIGYTGGGLAFLALLSATGVDMSSIAIVAGAFSVGIGFGLQAIFNNFISGLILLFERPVRVGDWVVAGGVEGIIKRIRVRSTQIETFYNAAVIVPNSVFITESVTNWTLHDMSGRVDVKVSVAHGSDVRLVQRLLYELAKDHEEVLAFPESSVLFMNFGEFALNFELRCFIRNIRNFPDVASELRFAIDKAFRENGIVIPVPQRDLRIVSTPSGASPAIVNNDDE